MVQQIRPGDDPRVKLAEEDALLLDEWLLGVLRAPSAPGNDDQRLLNGLLQSTKRAFRHLHLGWSSDASYAAWACRNLFDLRVFARFAFASVDNRRKLTYDWLLQEEGIAESRLPLPAMQAAKPGSPDNEALLDQLWARVRMAMALHGTQLYTMRLAHEVGLADDAATMQRLCGRLIRPSPLSILSPAVEEQSVRDELLILGSTCLSAVVADAGPAARIVSKQSRGFMEARGADQRLMQLRQTLADAFKRDSHGNAEDGLRQTGTI